MPLNSPAMEEAPDAAIADAYRRIAGQAELGKLVFPTHAEIGLRIRRALDDPNCSAEQAAKLIQAEPLLAARVVAVANSVAYNRSGREIADLRQAVARLGFATLRSLAMSVLVRQMSGQPAAPALKATVQRLWEHTAHVAALAHVIARRITKIDPETALFAGIVHEAAGFYLISRANELPAPLDGPPALWQGEGEAAVGEALFRVLELPEVVAAAIRDLWQGYLAIPPTSLGDTLLLAEELAPVASPLYWSPEREAGAEAGAPRIEIALDEETLTSILAESAGEVDSLIAALK